MWEEVRRLAAAGGDAVRTTGTRTRRLTLVAVGAAVLVDLVVLLVVSRRGVDPGLLMRDTTEALDAPFWVGSVSTLGVVVWVAGAAIALFAAAVAPDRGGEHRRLLLAFGLFNAFLALDDAFRFHEKVSPDVLGIPQRVVLPAYLLVAAVLLLRFRGALAGTFWPPGALAAVMFAVSMGVDVLVDGAHYLEDAPKLIGIFAATAYLVVLSFDVVRGRWRAGTVTAAGPPADGVTVVTQAPPSPGPPP